MGRKRTESAEKEKKDDDMGRKIDTKTKWWKNMKKEEKTSREASQTIPTMMGSKLWNVLPLHNYAIGRKY